VSDCCLAPTQQYSSYIIQVLSLRFLQAIYTFFTGIIDYNRQCGMFCLSFFTGIIGYNRECGIFCLSFFTRIIGYNRQCGIFCLSFFTGIIG
jgi:hypothetical protein